MSSQEEHIITPDTNGYEAVPELEELLRGIPSVHYDKRPRGTSCPSLHDALDIGVARAELAAAQQTGYEAYDLARIALARHATELVSGALWFDPGENSKTGKWRPWGIGELVADQWTDCYGHTIVLSACLEQMGVEHFIAYTNGHTFVVLPTGSGNTSSAWIFDAVPKESRQDLSRPTNPALAQDLSDAIEGKGFEGIADQVVARGRGVFALNARALVAKFARANETFETASQRNPWLNAAGRRPSTESTDNNSTLTVSVFEAKQGREMLARLLAFQRAAGKADFRAAALLVLDLAGQFPDLEAGNPVLLNTMRATANWLCQQGDFELAVKVTEAYFSSLRPYTGAAALHEGKIWVDIASRLARLGHLGVSSLLPASENQSTVLLSTVRRAAGRALVNAKSYDPSHAPEVSWLTSLLPDGGE